jgi:hypothetical protein
VTALRALRLTAEARRRLGAGAGEGRVHSAFARTINLGLDGLGAQGWLSLHGPGPIPSPFGIACETLPAVDGLGGVAARIGPDGLVIEGRLRLDVHGALVEDSALPDAAPSPAVPVCLALAGPRVVEGLLPVVAAWFGGAANGPATPLARLAGPALQRLREATARGDGEGCMEAATALVGLGPGLTPSGDDCLVGWLTALRVAGPEPRRLADAVGPGLLARAAGRTSPLSLAFLAAAAAGHVAVSVRRFVLQPDATGLDGLLGLGETSGADLLAGYLATRDALAS